MKDTDYQGVRMMPKDAEDHLKPFGLVVVPIKPSPDMLISATKIGNVSAEAAWNIYNAMVNAYRNQADYPAAIETHFRRDVREQPGRPDVRTRNP